VALRHGCEDIAEYLTERTANILARNRAQQTVFDVACTPSLRKRYKEKFELMSGASLNTLNYASTYQEHYQRVGVLPPPEVSRKKGRKPPIAPAKPTAAEEERSRTAELELLAMLEAEEQAEEDKGKKKGGKKKKKG
jgi:hypothetical protein